MTAEMSTIGDEGVSLLYDLSKEELSRLSSTMPRTGWPTTASGFRRWRSATAWTWRSRLITEAWRYFTVIEARRIMERLGMKPGGGIPALVECLKHRFYARLNLQDVIEQSDTRVVFRMLDCRVQSARKRKGLADYPCKSVGIVEYSEFARTIDPRIRTKCIACPPDEHPDELLVCLGIHL